MNQQKSNNIGDAELQPIQISGTATPTFVTGACHLVPDDLDSRLDGRHLQSLGGGHDDHHNCQLESGARTESHEPQIEREEGTLHSALEHSRVPGPATLAAGIRQHDEHMRGISWCRVLLIIQVKEAKSNLKIPNSRVAFLELFL